MSNSNDGDAMEVDATPPPEAEAQPKPTEETLEEDEEEEKVSDLVELLESTEDDTLSAEAQIPILSSILTEPEKRYGPKATSVKERSIYALARSYCASERYDDVVDLLTGDVCRGFFDNVTKAKCAKVVRAVLDVVCSLAPEQLDMVSSASSFTNGIPVPTSLRPARGNVILPCPFPCCSKRKFVAILSRGVRQKKELFSGSVWRQSLPPSFTNRISTVRH
mmetsp:Transcript_2181/g.5797  ORF Transcript_2181/g.5797 Transcript_2181/m.5797 type:complete len:221 (+) Transcript_2181:120-782(+)